MCLEDYEEKRPAQSRKRSCVNWIEEEATFAERLTALLEVKGMSPGGLADAVGVGQPAISMMLARQCRPQRRTVEKIANVLKVAPEELSPGIKGE